MNVFAPVGASSKPVMVFIHGGRFVGGAAGVTLYSADILANTSDTVVVTLNYRLGALGFLVTDGIPGNFGATVFTYCLTDRYAGLILDCACLYALAAMYDQLMALNWVQSNIGAFGGDPGRVTLFGQSAVGPCAWVYG